jgi:hypothetical protein
MTTDCEKRAFIHIGLPKTGTTSLQGFLHTYSTKYDLYYPPGVCYPPKHGLKFRAEESEWNEFLGFIRTWLKDRSAPPVMVLSEEGFFSRIQEPVFAERMGAVKGLSADVEFTIVCYLRPQDAWVISWYKQLIKTGLIHKHGYPDLNDFVDKMNNLGRLDYLALLRKYADLFGKESVRIRPFERCHWDHGDLVTDFLKIMGRQRRREHQAPYFQESITDLAAYLFLEIARGYTPRSLDEAEALCEYLRTIVDSNSDIGDFEYWVNHPAIQEWNASNATLREKFGLPVEWEVFQPIVKGDCSASPLSLRVTDVARLINIGRYGRTNDCKRSLRGRCKEWYQAVIGGPSRSQERSRL